ncbi:unnamed protein product [Stenotrophomonas maltophilia]|nr:unnamed protein product [Stenotrophomonas maltophilia]
MAPLVWLACLFRPAARSVPPPAGGNTTLGAFSCRMMIFVVHAVDRCCLRGGDLSKAWPWEAQSQD